MERLVIGAAEKPRDSIDDHGLGDREGSQHGKQKPPFGRNDREIEGHADS